MGNEDGHQPNSIPSMVSTFIQFHQQVPMQQRAVGFGHWKDAGLLHWDIGITPALCQWSVVGNRAGKGLCDPTAIPGSRIQLALPPFMGTHGCCSHHCVPVLQGPPNGGLFLCLRATIHFNFQNMYVTAWKNGKEKLAQSSPITFEQDIKP